MNLLKFFSHKSSRLTFGQNIDSDFGATALCTFLEGSRENSRGVDAARAPKGWCGYPVTHLGLES